MYDEQTKQNIKLYRLQFVVKIDISSCQQIRRFRDTLISARHEIRIKIAFPCQRSILPAIMLFLDPNPKGWGPIDSGCPSVCPSVIDSFPNCIFVTNGCRDLGIG